MPSTIGRDGFSATRIEEGFSPEEMVLRLRDMRNAWERSRGMVSMPSAYEGQRFTGRGTMPHGGPRAGPRERFDDDPVGYAPHVSFGRTKRRMKVKSRRPGLPNFTDAADLQVVEHTADYVTEGKQPRTRRKL